MQTEILKIDQNTLRNTYAEIYRNILNKSEIMHSNVAISIATIFWSAPSRLGTDQKIVG